MLTKDSTPNDLAIALGTSLPKLNYRIYAKSVDYQYSSFNIYKKNGGIRRISSPNDELKFLLLRLKCLLEEIYKPNPAASAFISKRGITYNARKHLRKKYVLNIDLNDFYGQIHFGRIFGLLTSKPYELKEDTARIIAHMTCFEKKLPQGAPSSPILSNMICRRLDRELSYLAKTNHAVYTRYADDITFSFRSDKSNKIVNFKTKKIKKELRKIIQKNGFSINEKKTRLQSWNESQVVTGIKVNKRLNLDRRYIRTTSAMIHSMSLDLESSQLKYQEKNPNSDASIISVVHGKVTFIGMIKGRENSVYQKLATAFNSLDLDLKLPLAPPTRNTELEQSLHFRSYRQRSHLESCVWIVDFEGVEGISDEGEFIQGTAFTIEGGRIITAAHTFEKADNPDYCFLSRINQRHLRYKANIVGKHSGPHDLAELDFVDDKPERIPALEIAPECFPNTGYMVSLTGFPELMLGDRSVAIIPSIVINQHTRSSLNYIEIDQTIRAGNSGGPLLNAYMQVVGVALLGPNISLDGDNANLEGRNACISAEYIRLPLPGVNTIGYDSALLTETQSAPS